MPIQFNEVPNDIRVPGVYIEVDNSRANKGLPQLHQKMLVIGQRTSDGEVTAGTLTLVTSVAKAQKDFGAGSLLANMIAVVKKNNPWTECWALPLDDDGAGAPAAGVLDFNGSDPTQNGSLYLYIGGHLVKVPILATDSDANIATKVAAKINANPSLPVSAATDDDAVNLTCKNDGSFGNEIDLRFNFRGLAGGEKTPDGVTVAITQMASGANNPDLETALATLPDETYDYIICPYTDSGNLAALHDALATRWGPLKMLEGHAFTAYEGTTGSLQTFGTNGNSQYIDCMGYNNSPNPPYEWASAYGAQVAFAASIDPARPYSTLPLKGILAPPKESLFPTEEQNTLLYSGIATFEVVRGVVQIQRAITMYQVNETDVPDPSYLDTTTPLTLSVLRQTARIRLKSKFKRFKVANDGTRFGPGQNIVTPSIIRAELLALFQEWERQGWVENFEQFKQDLIVERDDEDPTRINALMPPDLVNPLYIIAAQLQFLV